MYNQLNTLIVEYVQVMANRAWMQERISRFTDILNFIRVNNRSIHDMTGVSDMRFAAMITHTINWGE